MELSMGRGFQYDRRMCELFAISSAAPTRVHYSLEEFSKHGGLTHINKSGWGISYYHERDASIFKEAAPASDSRLARFIAEQGLPSRCVIAHAHKRVYDDGGVLSDPRPPGLHLIRRSGLAVQGLKVTPLERELEEEVDGIMLASVPLTPDGWTGLGEGTVVVLQNGTEIERNVGG